MDSRRPLLTYLDTSALVRLALEEGNVSSVSRALHQGPVSSMLARVELRSALYGRWRRGQLSMHDRDTFLAASDRELFDKMSLIDLSADVLRRAERIVEAHALRALDALHVATAVVVRDRTFTEGTQVYFCTADNRQF